MKFSKLLTDAGKLLSNQQHAREIIVKEIALFGELKMMDIALEAGRSARSHKEGRTVSRAEFLADVVNDQLMSGKVEGIEFCKCVDKAHL